MRVTSLSAIKRSASRLQCAFNSIPSCLGLRYRAFGNIAKEGRYQTPTFPGRGARGITVPVMTHPKAAKRPKLPALRPAGRSHDQDNPATAKRRAASLSPDDVWVSRISRYQENQDLLCRVQGRCLFGEPIDQELGDLVRPRPGAAFTYVRYNRHFTAGRFRNHRHPARRGLPMDDPGIVPFLTAAGREYAADSVQIEHLR